MSLSTYDDVVSTVFEEEPEVTGTDPYLLDEATDQQDEGHQEDGEMDQAADEAQEADENEVQASDAVGVARKPRLVKQRPKRGAKKRRRSEAPEAAVLSEEEKIVALRRQIEYYFSDKNLSQDEFFHEKISANPEGWLDSSWILGCNRVKKLGVSNETDIEAALQECELEIQWIAGDDETKTLQVGVHEQT